MYDFLDKAGYVAPGVNLIIKDMKETEQNGRDVYVTKDMTISVTCKPINSYSISATNWANDMYRDRLDFPSEHEVPISLTGTPELPRTIQTHPVFF